MTAASNAALATAQVGGRTYPIKVVPQCRICSHPQRLDIEAQIVRGRPYKAIADSLPEEHRPSADSLRRHVQSQHMPFEAEAVERLREEQAAERGQVVAEGAEVILDHVRFARGILRRVSEAVCTGELQPTVRDGLMAAEFCARYEQEPDIDRDAVVRGLMVLMETARDVMSRDQWREFSKRVGSDPVLAELRSSS